MSARDHVAKMRLALKAVKGRLDCAEARLAGALAEIRDRAAELRDCKTRLAEAPLPEGGEPAFIAFADRRRAALRARIAALTAALNNLYTEEKTRRAEVERRLREKISLEAAADAALKEAEKAAARRA
ncbi:MAG: hypothetical protein A3E78_00295 [Alphaproteobacteria bacterium RIFCSPHIGHO2_12_FULL_63_12]|nr:MAG: hypothetical protein A3E78_00295 [Alphaproteobacteria bacterium RIFCSPHIGHO2_12_FULL_63_12]